MTARVGAIATGLVSVTFRQLPAPEVIELAVQAQLEQISWGGDVHVPHGEFARAEAVGDATRAAGLRLACYGSYHRLGRDPDGFPAVLDTAVALGAPAVRVWAGERASVEATGTYRRQVVAEARRLGDQASAEGLEVVFEYHAGTLTDAVEPASRLLREIDHPAVGLLWQPPIGMPHAEARESLRRLLPWVRNVHVFHWWPDHESRRPLAEAAEAWREHLRILRDSGRCHAALLEFVREDAAGAFLADAHTLRRLVRNLATSPTGLDSPPP